MAKEKAQNVDAVILRDCVFGNGGEVVTVTLSDAETGIEQGMLDTSAEAVKYALSQK